MRQGDHDLSFFTFFWSIQLKKKFVKKCDFFEIEAFKIFE